MTESAEKKLHDPQTDTASSGTPPALAAVAAATKRNWWLRLAGFGIPLLVFSYKIGSSGIWDPHELNVADHARRIAIHVWGAQSLELADAQNSMPTIEMLGRGELPFTSIALGFAAFGLHEWAGRLPMAAWGMFGIAAVYWMFKRMIDEKAAAYAAIVLSTMPLYFVHARTMLGDVVTMASVAIAAAGLTVAVFDRNADKRTRAAALLIGIVGLFTGFLSRGILLGVALPLLSVGLAWTISVVGSRRRVADAFGTASGAMAAVVGLLVALVGALALFSTDAAQMQRLLGVTIAPPAIYPTFDEVISYLGHGLFPWSAFVPFAIGRLFRPPLGVEPDALDKERALRAVLMVGGGLAYGALAMMAPKTGHVPFAGVVFLAGIAAIAVRDLERGAPASRTLAIGVVTFLALFYRDFKMWPEKGMSPYGVASSFPDTFKDTAGSLLLTCMVVFAVLVFSSWLERDEPGRKPFDLSEYKSVLLRLRKAGNGNLVFVAIVVEAALAVFAIVFVIGMQLRWRNIITMSATIRKFALNGWWVVPVAAVAIVVGAFLFRDLFRWLFPSLKLPRASATLVGGAVAGAVLSFSYYPALATQLSPKEVFDAYAQMSAPEEKLALLGVNSRAASYYSGGKVDSFSGINEAFQWLMAGTDRRWLVIRSDDLPKLNSMYRGRARPVTNLPVLDARSSQILLVSNQLQADETNHNPLDAVLLPSKPQPMKPLDADFQGQLRALGWEVWDSDGKPVPAVTAGKNYRLRLYYEVTGRISANWKSFVHIDGHGRRFNGDHDVVDNKYPMSLWQPGDYVVDDFPFSLEPNFTPGGYMLYYGFFIGDSRLEVARGKHHENRLEGGEVQVQ